MNITISPAEKLTLLYALTERMAKLTQYADDCEKLPECPFPTDDPEHWREQLRETSALFQRVSKSHEGANK